MAVQECVYSSVCVCAFVCNVTCVTSTLHTHTRAVNRGARVAHLNQTLSVYISHLRVLSVKRAQQQQHNLAACIFLCEFCEKWFCLSGAFGPRRTNQGTFAKRHPKYTSIDCNPRHCQSPSLDVVFDECACLCIPCLHVMFFFYICNSNNLTST